MAQPIFISPDPHRCQSAGGRCPNKKEGGLREADAVVLVAARGALPRLTGCGSSDDEGAGAVRSSSRPLTPRSVVILPDTESSVRWETAERPALTAAFKEAGSTTTSRTRRATPTNGQIADSRIPVRHRARDRDLDTPRVLHRGEGKNQGIATIDYDRSRWAGPRVLRLLRQREGRRAHGQGLQSCLGRTRGEHRYLNGSPTTPTPRRSPRARTASSTEHDYTKSTSRPPRLGQRAAGRSLSRCHQANGKIDGVLAANDVSVGAAIAIWRKRCRGKGRHRTGRDGPGPAGHPRGQQCMTVYSRPSRRLARWPSSPRSDEGRRVRPTALDGPGGQARRPLGPARPGPGDQGHVKGSSTTVAPRRAEVCKGFEKECRNGIS